MVRESSVGIFIIESLDLKDEEKGLFEGKILEQVLKMINIPVQYRYIRTKQELKVMIEQFEKSGYRYLHLSCHGNSSGIGMTLDKYSFSFAEFKNMFEKAGIKKRLFLSSCSVLATDKIKNELFGSDFISIIGPRTDIKFSDAMIFWASMYQQLFRVQQQFLRNDDIFEITSKLSKVFNLDIVYLGRKEASKEYFEKNIE